MVNFTDAEKYCQLVKNTLDQKWLIEKRSTMTPFGKKNIKKINTKNQHPLALLIHNTERTIELEKIEKTYKISENILRLSKIGIDIETLQQHTVSGLDEKIESLMSNDLPGIEKTLFELSMASLLVRQNHSVQFLKTRANLGKRTPDLLVDDNIEFECTKTDMLTEIQKQNQIKLEGITKKILTIFNEFNSYCFVFVEYDDTPNRKQIDETLRCVRKSIINKKFGKFNIINGSVTIEQIFTNKTEESKINSKNTNPRHQNQVEIFNEILELLDLKVGINAIKEKLSSKTDYDLIQYRGSSKQEGLFLGELQYIAIKSGEFPNRLRGILKRIKDKTEQFSKDKPALICLNISNIISKLTPADHRSLRMAIDKVLSTNPHISSITVVSEEIVKANNHMNFRQSGVIITNNFATHPLPKNMNFIGLSESK